MKKYIYRINVVRVYARPIVREAEKSWVLYQGRRIRKDAKNYYSSLTDARSSLILLLKNYVVALEREKKKTDEKLLAHRQALDAVLEGVDEKTLSEILDKAGLIAWYKR